MQEYIIQNCFFFYTNSTNKNGVGLKNARAVVSQDIFKLYDVAGSLIYTFPLTNIKSLTLTPAPGEPMLGVGKEVMVNLYSDEDFFLQPSEEDREYLDGYEAELVAVYDYLQQGIATRPSDYVAPPYAPVYPVFEHAQNASKSKNLALVIVLCVLFLFVVPGLVLGGSLYYYVSNNSVEKPEPVYERDTRADSTADAFSNSLDVYLAFRQGVYEKDKDIIEATACEVVDAETIDFEKFSNISYRNVKLSEDEKEFARFNDYEFKEQIDLNGSEPGTKDLELLYEHKDGESTYHMSLVTQTVDNDTCLRSVLVRDQKSGGNVLAGFGAIE